MRILLLADINSSHTQKWAIGLANNNVAVGIFSFNKADSNFLAENKNIQILFQPTEKPSATSFFDKLSYLKYLGRLKKEIKNFKPNILHAHYATSYGLLGALSNFKPFIISAWGTDVMQFPQSNFLNKAILKFNFKRADVICATSKTIANYIHPISKKTIEIIPFGIDLQKFKPNELNEKSNHNIVFSCIKSLEKIYNIDLVIKAFSKLIIDENSADFRLQIVGGGSEECNLKKLCNDLKISQLVTFTGKIPSSEIPFYCQKMDVLVNISAYESFGVSVIEAMACEKAVIASNVGGLAEIIKNEEDGLLVTVNNIEEVTAAMKKLAFDSNLRQKLGKNGRIKVENLYNWTENLNRMIEIYSHQIKSN